MFLNRLKLKDNTKGQDPKQPQVYYSNFSDVNTEWISIGQVCLTHPAQVLLWAVQPAEPPY